MASSVLSPFIAHIPARPYCTDDLSTGLQIRPKVKALQRVYIQPNGPGMVWALVFDVDRPVVNRKTFSPIWEDAGLPEPNFVTINRINWRGHLVYVLAAGVTTTRAARMAALRYLASIERAMCAALGADPGYAGLVTKNPLNSRWRVWEIHNGSFTLGELAEYLDLGAAMPTGAKEAHGLGRNCTLFDDGRKWAYSAIKSHWAPNGLPQWSEAVLERLMDINGQFLEPLPFSEVKATARSIAKWTWTHITPQGRQDLIQRTHTPEKQAERGRKATNQADIAALGGKASGQARRWSREQQRATARLLRARGMTYMAIADELGVPFQTIWTWCQG